MGGATIQGSQDRQPAVRALPWLMRWYFTWHLGPRPCPFQNVCLLRTPAQRALPPSTLGRQEAFPAPCPTKTRSNSRVRKIEPLSLLQTAQDLARRGPRVRSGARCHSQLLPEVTFSLPDGLSGRGWDHFPMLLFFLGTSWFTHHWAFAPLWS